MPTNTLTVIMPVYNEGAIIRSSVQRTDRVLNEAGIAHDFVLVDDGSRDDTWIQLSLLANDLPNVRAIKLSRNFGKEGAMSAGLDHARGECAVIMDCDMQHPPEILPEMVRKWRDEGYKVVEGKKRTRGNESGLKRWAANTFYGLLHKSSGIDLMDASDFRLLDREAIEAWKRMPERQTFFRAMSSWVGFPRTQVEFDVAERAGGQSRFSLTSLVRLALHAIASFSAMPLHMITVAGGLMLALFAVMGGQTLYMKLAGKAVEGFTTVILLQLIIGGITLVAMGVIGLYIAKIYEEVKGRPRYLIERMAGEATKGDN